MDFCRMLADSPDLEPTKTFSEYFPHDLQYAIVAFMGAVYLGGWILICRPARLPLLYKYLTLYLYYF